MGIERNLPAIGVLPQCQEGPAAAGHLPAFSDCPGYTRALEDDIGAAAARSRIEDEPHTLVRLRDLDDIDVSVADADLQGHNETTRGTTDGNHTRRARKVGVHRGSYPDRSAPLHCDRIASGDTGYFDHAMDYSRARTPERDHLLGR
jgi:hypothetical protein